MSLDFFLKLIRSIIIIILLIFSLGCTYKFMYYQFSKTEWAIQQRQKIIKERESFYQIRSSSRNASSTSSTIEEFKGIFQIQQKHLKIIELVNIQINRSLLIQSLKYCQNLQILKLINVTFAPSITNNFEERVHLPNLRQYSLTLKTTSFSPSPQPHFIEDDIQIMQRFRSWELFKTLIPFTTMGFQEAKSVDRNLSLSQSNDDNKKHDYSIEDFNWLVVSSNTDMDLRIGNVKLFTVIHSEGLLLSFLHFNQALLHQIQQPNTFELKHLYLLDGSSSISIDTIPNNLITLFSYKLYEKPNAKNSHRTRLLSRQQIKSQFEIKISQLRKIRELRIFLHPNVKWLDLHSISPIVRHLAISNAILTNHQNVRFIFLQNLSLDVYLIDDETIVDQLPIIFPYVKKVVLDFSSINSEVHERKILTQILRLPSVEWIVVRFYQIRRFKVWTEYWEIEKFLNNLGIGENSDCFLITRSLSRKANNSNEWKAIDLDFDQVRVLTGQLSADAEDFIISQAEAGL